MKIEKLLSDVEILSYHNFDQTTKNLNISQVCDNSCDKNIKNSLFVCINGLNFDSHNEISELENKGVRFFVCEKEIETKCPFVVVKSSRKSLPKICDNFYNHPTKSFALIGVVGTNGKTSTSHFVCDFLHFLGKRCSVIGTSGVFVNRKRFDCSLTTPDPIELYKIFDRIRKNKNNFAIMEVSAHAIKLEKVNNLIFDALIFTNFSQDHLDFFASMDEYKKTKFSIFNKFNAKKAFINFDDDAGKELFDKIKNEIPTFTFGKTQQCDFSFLPQKATIFGTNFILTMKKEYVKFFDIKNLKSNFSCDDNLWIGVREGESFCCTNFFSRVPCEFNLYNIVGAMLCAVNVLDCTRGKLEKQEISKIKFCNGVKKNEEKLITKKMVENLRLVKGRFDLIETLNEKNILIDFAHTPESLKLLLENVKNLCNLKIVALLGCPGNRDETKREIMGKICYDYCEKVYITSDNPCYENPLIIANEIKKGTKEKGEVIENRKKAIKKAIKNLKKDEILCIIGKGSENFQDINGEKYEYSDYIEVEKCIKKLKK